MFAGLGLVKLQQEIAVVKRGLRVSRMIDVTSLLHSLSHIYEMSCKLRCPFFLQASLYQSKYQTVHNVSNYDQDHECGGAEIHRLELVKHIKLQAENELHMVVFS